MRGVDEGCADPQGFIPDLIALYREGCFSFDRLVGLFDFAALGQAIAAGESGRVGKPVLGF